MNIVIHLQYYGELAFSEWRSLEKPECKCGAGQMSFICDTDAPNCPTRFKSNNGYWPDEVWGCNTCHHMQRYEYGEYGSREITYTPEEYADKTSPERQEYWLRKRYKTAEPVSIKDYWQ